VVPLWVSLTGLLTRGLARAVVVVAWWLARAWRLSLPATALVGSYLFDGYWLDIGRHEDYERAIAEFGELKPLLMREDSPALSNGHRSR